MAPSILLYLKELAGDIGCRANGSQGNKLASEYIEKHFQSLGLSTTRQYYPSVKWTVQRTSLTLGNELLAAVANGYSVSCDVIAPFMCVCNFEELERINCENRILVLYGDLSKNELEAKPITEVPRYFPPEARRLYEYIEKTPPLALVFVSHHNRETSLHNDPYCNIPSLTVPIEAGQKILKTNSLERMSIQIQALREESQSWNVIAKKEGKRPEKIVISAHFDTKFYCPGAYDNGSGIVIVMALAEMLTKHDWEYGLEFIGFNSEETGPISGDEVYLEENGLALLPFSVTMKVKQAEAFKPIVAVINFDRVGILAGTDSISTLQCSSGFRKLVKNCREQFPGIIYQSSLPCSNHYVFSSHGVPCVSCTSNERVYTAHTADDTWDWLSESKLNSMKDLVYEIVKNLMLESEPLSLRKDW